jgi:hypothetical protein
MGDGRKERERARKKERKEDIWATNLFIPSLVVNEICNVESMNEKKRKHKLST